MTIKKNIYVLITFILFFTVLILWNEISPDVYAGSDGAWDASTKAANKADSLLNKGSYIDGNDFLRSNVQDTFTNLVGDTILVTHQGSRSKLTICSDEDSIEIRGRVKIDTVVTTILKMGEVYGFPTVDGDDGQVIKTDGSGGLSWKSDNVGEVGGGATAGEVSDSCDVVRGEIPDTINVIRGWSAIIDTINVYDDDTQPRSWSDVGDTCDAHDTDTQLSWSDVGDTCDVHDTQLSWSDVGETTEAHISFDSLYFLHGTDWTSEGWLLNTDTIQVDTSSAGGVTAGEISDSCNVVRGGIPDSINVIRGWSAIAETAEVYCVDEGQVESITEAMLNCENVPVDEYILSYEADGSKHLQWKEMLGGGDANKSDIGDSCNIVRGEIPDTINAIRSWSDIGDTCDAHDTQLSWSDVGDTCDVHDTNTQLDWSDVGETTDVHINDIRGWSAIIETINVYDDDTQPRSWSAIGDTCDAHDTDTQLSWSDIGETTEVHITFDSLRLEYGTEWTAEGWFKNTDTLQVDTSSAGEIGDSCDVLRTEMPDSAKGVAGDTANVLRGEIPDSINAIRGWSAIAETAEVYCVDEGQANSITEAMLNSPGAPTDEYVLSWEADGSQHLQWKEMAGGGDANKSDIGDTANVLRAEMPDSARGVVGDTASILRGEIDDSCNVVRGEIADSVEAHAFTGITLNGNLTMSGGAYDIILKDEESTALEIKEGANVYLVINTASLGGEKITFLKPININNAYTLPTSDGDADQILKTNGSGSVTWQADATGGGGGGGRISETFVMDYPTSKAWQHVDFDSTYSEKPLVFVQIYNNKSLVGKKAGAGSIFITPTAGCSIYAEAICSLEVYVLERD